MPSTQSRPRLLGLLLLLCLCTQSAAGAVATPRPEANTGCFPGDAHIERGEAVGDVVELEMLLCFRGSVTVDGPGYAANASLGDGNWSGGVTLRFDTRLNGSRALEASTERDHSVTMNATGDGSFEPGTYTVTVRDWGGDVVDTLNFKLGQPQARNLTILKAPAGAASNLQNLSAVRGAVAVSPADSARRFDDPNTSEHLSLATNETLIVAVRADGLEGAVTAGGGTPLSRFRTAVTEAGGRLSLRQTDETVTVQREPLTPSVLNDSVTHLVPDPDNDTYYLVVDTHKLWGEWGGSHGGPVNVGSRPGMGYAVRFSMWNATDGDDPPADLVAADFLIVKAALAGPETVDELTLRPTENASLRLRTTLAAGTPVTVRMTGHPEGQLERHVRVQRFTNGSGVALGLNLSGVPNGTALTVTAERGNETVEGEVTAVVRAAPNTTETQTTAPPPTTKPSSEESPTESDSLSTTQRQVSGFGALPGVAALLLMSAALHRIRN